MPRQAELRWLENGRREDAMPNKKPAVILLSLGAVLLLCGGLWLGSNANAGQKAAVSARQILAEMGRPAAPRPSPSAPPSESSSQPTVQELASDALGILEIPSLSLELPVLDDCSEELLERSVCRYAGTDPSLPGFVIAGHSYEEHFGMLSRLAEGNSVVFYLRDGTELQYSVAELAYISGNAPEELQAEDWDLTLFTCSFDGSDRLLIRCKRT